MSIAISNHESLLASGSVPPLHAFGPHVQDGGGSAVATDTARPWLGEYPPGVPYEIGPLPHASLAALFEDSMRRFRDRAAFSNLGSTITYAELDRASRDFGAYLQKRCG